MSQHDDLTGAVFTPTKGPWAGRLCRVTEVLRHPDVRGKCIARPVDAPPNMPAGELYRVGDVRRAIERQSQLSFLPDGEVSHEPA